MTHPLDNNQVSSAQAPLAQAPLVQGTTGLWEVVIGLEVHAQIISNAKLFSNASTEFGADPNTQVDFLDAGMPGILPVLNSWCVDQAIKTGLGFHGDIQHVSIFDRKNYFYADLPLGYQISQFTHPIILGGYLDIDLDTYTKRVPITRLHMEQDAGKSIHDMDPRCSFIDLNRAGVALMEIVSEPMMNSAAEAQAYVKVLRTLLRYLNTCDGNMEQGSLRVDANVSLHRPGTPFGTRAEIKNVNSIRFLGQAIDYEIQRQLEILESGGEVIQETRLFDPQKGETRSMRSKENATDYRYFPDPDLPPLVVTQERIETIRLTMPELPFDKKQRFIQDYQLSSYDATILVSEVEIAAFYEEILKHTKQAKLAANWLISEVFGAMKKENLTLDTLPLTPRHIGELVSMIDSDIISGKIGKDVFAKMWQSQEYPEALVTRLNLGQISDPVIIEQAVQNILAANADKVESYRQGKEQLFGFFVGTVLKRLEGRGNPAMVNEILKRLLTV